MVVVSVATATSNSGTACVRELLSSAHLLDGGANDDSGSDGQQGASWTVRACVRSEERKRVLEKDIAEANTPNQDHLQITSGVDALAPPTLPAAFEGAAVAVIITPIVPEGFSKDAEATANLINAAATAGVKHIVYIGSWTVHQCERLSQLAQRFAPSEMLLHRHHEDTGITWTTLRGGYFATNLVHILAPKIKEGAVSSDASSTATTIRFPAITVPPCDPRDIGRVAAHVAADHATGRRCHHAHCYEICGPEMLTMDQIVSKVATACGRRLVYEPIPAAALMGVVPEYLAQLLLYLEEEGERAVPLSDDVVTVTGRPGTSLDEWLQSSPAAAALRKPNEQ